MKEKLLFLFFIALLNNTAFTQSHSFSDDFESYEIGDYLCLNSDRWITWLDVPGTPQDIIVTDENSNNGSNAIKFLNPEDQSIQFVILPYSNEKIVSGALNTKMSLLVETNAKLKFRSDLQVGGMAAINVLFETDGTGVVNNHKNENLITFDYPLNEWFAFELDINFEANKWHLEINGSCMGTFASNINSISALDFHPTKDDSYFLDDFSYTYIDSGHEIKNDARLQLKSDGLYGFEGNEILFQGELINGGSEVINSSEFLFEYAGDEFLVELSDLNINNGESVLFDVEGEHKFTNQIEQAKLKIEKINGGDFFDEDRCNDDADLMLKGATPAEHKKIISEEGTARWCWGCPLGIVQSKYMTRKYPDRFIPITVHIGDPMSFQEYEDNLPVPFIPAAIINRDYYIYPDTIEKAFLNEIVHESLSSSIHGAKFDEETRELQISLLTTSRGLITDQHKINIVLTEDGVHGVGEFWSQLNWFSQREDLIDVDGLNWKDLPSVVPAEQMKFDHVARAILASYTGLENSFEENLNLDEEKLFNFSYTVPDGFDLSKMNIVSMLINPDETINTGELSTVFEAMENGYMELTNSKDIQLTNAAHIYPNPATNTSSISINLSKSTDLEIQVLDLSGKVLLEKSFNNSIGYFVTNIDVSSFSAGNYIVNILAGDHITTKKLIVTR